MKDLVEYIARSLVESPDAVEVIADDDGRRLELRVAEEDRGKVIGRRGRTAHAIRSLLSALSPDDRHVTLDIVD